MIEFEIKGRKFRADKPNAIVQMHVMRRLTPLLTPLAATAKEIDPDDPGKLAAKILENPKLVEPLLEAFSALPDEALEYIMNACLGVVKVETAPGTWMQLWIQKTSQAIVLELNDFGELLPIVIHVVMETFGGFFAGILTSQPKGTQGS